MANYQRIVEGWSTAAQRGRREADMEKQNEIRKTVS